MSDGFSPPPINHFPSRDSGVRVEREERAPADFAPSLLPRAFEVHDGHSELWIAPRVQYIYLRWILAYTWTARRSRFCREILPSHDDRVGIELRLCIMEKRKVHCRVFLVLEDGKIVRTSPVFKPCFICISQFETIKRSLRT